MSQSILAGPSEIVSMYLRRASVKVRTLWLDVGYGLPVLLMRDGFCWDSSSTTLSDCGSGFAFFCSSCFERENIDLMKAKRGARVKVRTTRPLDVDILMRRFLCWILLRRVCQLRAPLALLLCTRFFAIFGGIEMGMIRSKVGILL